MGDTYKDSANKGTLGIEVVKRDDGSFDIFHNKQLVRTKVGRGDLSEVVCVRFGFCGAEYDEILDELERNGPAFRSL